MTRNPELDVYFGDGLLDAGFAPVPHLLLRHYRQLHITEEQLVFVLQLMAQKYDKHQAPEDLPDIAARMGKNVATARGYSRSLRAAGLLRVTPRFHNGAQIGNIYNLKPLWDALRSFAEPSPFDDAAITTGPELPSPISTDVQGAYKNTRGVPVKNTRLPRADLEDLALSKTPALGQAFLTGLNNKEQESTSDAVAAAAIFARVLSIDDARRLIAQHPEAIPHAEALVAEARSGKRPSGLLIHLVERGWTPPPKPDLAAADDELRYIRSADGSCVICGGDPAICRGQHVPDWLAAGNDDAA